MKTPPKTLNATIAQLVHGNALRSYIINVMIAHNGRISIAGIAKLMFRSREAIAKHIRMLEAMRVIQHVGTRRKGYWRVAPLNQAQLNQLMGIPPQLAQRFNVMRLKSHSTRVHENATEVHDNLTEAHKQTTEVHKTAPKVHNASTRVHNADYDDFFTVSYGY